MYLLIDFKYLQHCGITEQSGMTYTRTHAFISNFSSRTGQTISTLVRIFLICFDCIPKAFISQSSFADSEQTNKNNYILVFLDSTNAYSQLQRLTSVQTVCILRRQRSITRCTFIEERERPFKNKMYTPLQRIIVKNQSLRMIQKVTLVFLLKS